MPVIPAPGRLRQKDQEFKAAWGHKARFCLTNLNKKSKAKLQFAKV